MKTEIETLLDAALKNQGFESLNEFFSMSDRIPKDIDPSAVADHFDDPASAPLPASDAPDKDRTT